MARQIAFIGFGEAGQAFARPGNRAYDRKTTDAATAGARHDDYRAAGVTGCESAAEAIDGAQAVLSLVTAECALATHRTGVDAAVLASLDASWKPHDWTTRIDYNLDRMRAHRLRRAAEMEEVAATLEELGVEPAMTRGSIRRRHSLGSLGLTPPDGLAAKIAALGDTP